MSESSTLRRIRRLLLALVVAGTAVFILELVLIEHTESAWQWSPLVVLVAGLLVEGAALVRPGPGTLRALRAAMVLFIVFGLVGIYLHFRGNLLFELEMEPGAGGLGLLWRAAGGGVPTLAPAGLVGLGFVGLIHTMNHPSLRSQQGE